MYIYIYVKVPTTARKAGRHPQLEAISPNLFNKNGTELIILEIPILFKHLLECVPVHARYYDNLDNPAHVIFTFIITLITLVITVYH